MSDSKIKFITPILREIEDEELFNIDDNEIKDFQLEAYAGDGGRGGY